VRFQASPVTTEFERRWHPKEGDVVSFKHHGFLAATQKPKLASLYRIRTDITWNEVVDSWKAGKPLPQGSFTFLMFFYCDAPFNTFLLRSITVAVNSSKKDREPKGILVGY